MIKNRFVITRTLDKRYPWGIWDRKQKTMRCEYVKRNAARRFLKMWNVRERRDSMCVVSEQYFVIPRHVTRDFRVIEGAA